jgi:hypothetical protein
MRVRDSLGRLAAATTLAAALGSLGCAATYVRTPVYKQGETQIYLRGLEKHGKAIERGFEHPLAIAPVRLTNILARLEVKAKGDKEQRKPAIPTGVLYEIGEGAAQALGKANSSQEVVVMAIERKRSLGVFTTNYATTLLLWGQDGKLMIQLSKLDEPMSRDPNDKLQEPSTDESDLKKRKMLPGDGVEPKGPMLVAVDWRDPVFTQSAVRIRPGGEVVRRTILLETPEDKPAGEKDGGAAPPDTLSPEALRALADLEETRRRGELTESEYQSRRRAILSGEIPPAPSAPAAPSTPSAPSAASPPRVQ